LELLPIYELGLVELIEAKLPLHTVSENGDIIAVPRLP
jgi:hypothetical protein